MVWLLSYVTLYYYYYYFRFLIPSPVTRMPCCDSRYMSKGDKGHSIPGRCAIAVVRCNRAFFTTWDPVHTSRVLYRMTRVLWKRNIPSLIWYPGISNHCLNGQEIQSTAEGKWTYTSLVESYVQFQIRVIRKNSFLAFPSWAQLNCNEAILHAN